MSVAEAMAAAREIGTPLLVKAAGGLSDDCRRRLHQAAVRFAGRLSYQAAGTVEFLVDQQQDLAMPGAKLAKLLIVQHDVSRSASGPLRVSSAMWCDWSNRTAPWRQADYIGRAIGAGEIWRFTFV